ncbi:copper-containing nitrite reductase [Cereibacter azotoformans]|uniref:copper-containing nitrite reductase n=1 Tax=Cereibacter azotoformans TaxID=43057 RepID=UPI003B20E620
MFTRRAALVGAAALASAPLVIRTAGAEEAPAQLASAAPVDLSNLLRVKHTLVPPPFAHAHEQVAASGPVINEFEMRIIEKEVQLDEDAYLLAMTFDGSIPGPLMIVHEGDYVELTLINPPENTMPHNIDFHAATGALGGGGLTLINPGEKVVLRFKATRAGAFVYHCAPGGPMIPWHVVSGMAGCIMVLPRDGLKDHEGKPVRYDTVYYIGESDHYIPKDEDGTYMRFSDPSEGYEDMVAVMDTLIPSHIVFNGAVGALTGEGALKAKVGDNVLFVHSQPNRDSRPHLIGGHGDLVWETGKFHNAPERDLETWFIRGGSAGAALYRFLQPGVYAYVNHNLIEAVHKGATAHVLVEGEWDNDLMEQVVAPVGLTG